jgi:hypothetical protein
VEGDAQAPSRRPRSVGNGDQMTRRTTSKTVTFRRPFVLEGFQALLPAGEYVVDTDEEELDSMLLQGWRRVSTTMRVHIDGAVEMRTVDPHALDEALTRDGAQDEPGQPSPATARFARARAFVTYPVRRKKP